MSSWCRSECTCSNIYLQHERPLDIIKCWWPKIGRRTFLTYRIVVAVWFTVMLILAGVQSKTSKFLIYCTEWSMIVLTLSLIVKAVCVGLYLPLLKKSGQSLVQLPQTDIGEDSCTTPLIEKSSLNYVHTPALIQICWILNNISTSMALLVTVVYWTVLAPLKGAGEDLEQYGNIHAHLLNTVVVLLDVVLTTAPFRLAHIYQPVTFAVAYGAFDAIYWYAGGTTPTGTRPIYPILNWDKLEVTIPTLLGVTCAISIFHVIMCGITYCRNKSDSYYLDTDTFSETENANSKV